MEGPKEERPSVEGEREERAARARIAESQLEWREGLCLVDVAWKRERGDRGECAVLIVFVRSPHIQCGKAHLVISGVMPVATQCDSAARRYLWIGTN